MLVCYNVFYHQWVSLKPPPPPPPPPPPWLPSIVLYLDHECEVSNCRWIHSSPCMGWVQSSSKVRGQQILALIVRRFLQHMYINCQACAYYYPCDHTVCWNGHPGLRATCRMLLSALTCTGSHDERQLRNDTREHHIPLWKNKTLWQWAHTSGFHPAWVHSHWQHICN